MKLTIMIITLGGMFPGERSYLPFPDAKSCGDAILVISEMLEAQMIQCRETNLLTVSPRPMKRPEEE